MIVFATQKIANSDLIKHTLVSFHRPAEAYDGSLRIECVHCHLIYYSYEEMIEDIEKYGGNKLPENVNFSNVHEVKWSKGLHWKEKNW